MTTELKDVLVTIEQKQKEIDAQLQTSGLESIRV